MEEWLQQQSIPQTERPLAGGGRVSLKPGGLVEPGVTHYGAIKRFEDTKYGPTTKYDKEEKKYVKRRRKGKVYQSSDETLKENITDASSKLADVLNLKVRNFNWKSSHHPDMSDKKMIGFIAQEMESVFPNLVNEHDINPQGKDGTPNMKKGVKTTALIPILTKALQELSAKVTALEARVNTLEG